MYIFEIKYWIEAPSNDKQYVIAELHLDRVEVHFLLKL